jgi:acetoacetyl-CoA synthetase
MWRIKRQLKQRRSAHHVPGHVVEVPALPETWSGKVSGRAVRDLLQGRPVSNREALRNPEALDAIERAVQAAVS